MPIYKSIEQIKANPPTSLEAAQQFLNTLSPLVQDQLVAAIYLGAAHLNYRRLGEDPRIEVSRGYLVLLCQIRRQAHADAI